MKRSRPSVRFGEVLVTCEVSEVSDVVQQLRVKAPCGNSSADPIFGDDLYTAISLAQTAILGNVVEHFSVSGKAEKSLSTALRVRAVRSALGDHGVLLENLEYIAAAADAHRHLSPALVKRTVKELNDVLGAGIPPLAVNSERAPLWSSPSSSSTGTVPSVASPRSQTSTYSSSAPVLRDLLMENDIAQYNIFDDEVASQNTFCRPPVVCLPPYAGFDETALLAAYDHLVETVRTHSQELPATPTACADWCKAVVVDDSPCPQLDSWTHSPHAIKTCIDNLMNFKKAFAIAHETAGWMEEGKMSSFLQSFFIPDENDERYADLAAAVAEEMGIDDIISDELAEIYTCIVID